MRPRTLAAALALALGGVLLVATPALAHPVLHVTASPTTVTAGSTTTITISGTSNGNYTGARIEVFSATPSTGGTTGALTAFTSSPVCGGGTISCTEITSRYKLGLPTLTNGQVFSYTLTVTVDAATSAGTFTSKAQFYKSDNTTDGPTTGPLITVQPAQADLRVLFSDFTVFHGHPIINFYARNLGPATANDLTVTITVSRAGFGTLDLSSSTGFNCTTAGQDGTCIVGSNLLPLAPNDYDRYVTADYTLDLLALGSYVVTATGSTTLPDPNPANNSASVTCNVLTGLIVTCA